jgi:hypothetical protein
LGLKDSITIPGTKTKVPIWAVVGAGAAGVAALLLSRGGTSGAATETTTSDETDTTGSLADALANALDNLDQRIAALESKPGATASAGYTPSAPSAGEIPTESPDQSSVWDDLLSNVGTQAERGWQYGQAELLSPPPSTPGTPDQSAESQTIPVAPGAAIAANEESRLVTSPLASSTTTKVSSGQITTKPKTVQPAAQTGILANLLKMTKG